MSRPSITPSAASRCFRRVPPISIPEKKIANVAASQPAAGNICRVPVGGTGTAKDELGAAVCTVTNTFVVVVPLSVRESGDTVQLADAGAPLQLRDTDWLVAVPGASVSWYWAAWPGLIVALPVPEAVTVNGFALTTCAKTALVFPLKWLSPE